MDMMLSGRSHIMVCSLLLWMPHVDAAVSAAVDGVVVEREVISRQGDGLIYDNAFTSPLHAGTEFSVIEQRHA